MPIVLGEIVLLGGCNWCIWELSDRTNQMLDSTQQLCDSTKQVLDSVQQVCDSAERLCVAMKPVFDCTEATHNVGRK